MRILSIDGGGIRGIIPSQVLIVLEQQLQVIRNDPEFRIADAFDLIAGTSTGGILTCLYLCPDVNNAPQRPKFTATQAADLYLQHGDDIFDVSLFKRITSINGITDEKYSAAPLEKVLKEYLGDIRLSQLLKPCLIPAFDITRRQAKFFNSIDASHLGSDRDFYLRDVARATSAAPTYFEPANITSLAQKVYPLVDGGMFANNPTMCALVEAYAINPHLQVPDLKVLSLGTGTADNPYHYSEAKQWGELGWIRPALDIMMSGVSETVDFQLRTLFSSAGVPQQYLRLQLNLQEKDFCDVDSALDNASEKNMRLLKEAGQRLATTHIAALTAFAKLL